jgi:hypothetical protein
MRDCVPACAAHLGAPPVQVVVAVGKAAAAAVRRQRSRAARRRHPAVCASEGRATLCEASALQLHGHPCNPQCGVHSCELLSLAWCGLCGVHVPCRGVAKLSCALLVLSRLRRCSIPRDVACERLEAFNSVMHTCYACNQSSANAFFDSARCDRPNPARVRCAAGSC